VQEGRHLENFEPEEKREPWELPEYREGFDVYQYDEYRARKGQRIVIATFLIAFTLFLIAMYLSKKAVDEEHKKRLPPTRGVIYNNIK
jgi:hypothetical protein